ncbi:RNA-directed DNA polymerase, eukaryota [Tanacetum coccineum]
MTNSLPTRFNISRRGIDIESLSCVNCDVGIETNDHLFFACNTAKKISKLINRWWDVPFMDINSYGEWRSWIDNVKLPKKNKSMFQGKLDAQQTTPFLVSSPHKCRAGINDFDSLKLTYKHSTSTTRNERGTTRINQKQRWLWALIASRINSILTSAGLYSVQPTLCSDRTVSANNASCREIVNTFYNLWPYKRNGRHIR